MSLRTMQRSVARTLVARLDAVLEELTVSQDAVCLTQPQLNAMLGLVVTRHLDKLARIAAAAKSFPDFKVGDAQDDDARAAWAYALLDAQGWKAVVRPDDRKRMLADGLTEADVDAVQAHLAMLRFNNLVPTKAHILSQLTEVAGVPPTAMNMAQAQAVYFQGMKLALAQSERRYGADRAEETDFVVGVLKDRPIATSVTRSLPAGPNPQHVKPVECDETCLGAQATIPVGEITNFAEAVIKKKKSDGEWDVKTQRQARSITSLLVKFLRQESRIVRLDELRQSHLSDFIDFLRYEIYKFYGRSSRDSAKSIAQLRRDALDKLENQRGIIGETINRHLTFLAQVFESAVARGVEIHDKIDLTKLRSKKKKSVRARNARAKLAFDVLERVFRAPPFVNCAAWDELDKAGVDGETLVFHCALYFVPLLVYYCGGRREEFCGLMVDDVILDNGPTPYVHIAKNAQRRIKNLQSQRNISLHPELIRLGFLQYVAAIKALGYKLLFPDLFSPSTRSPMGDRFYTQFKPILLAAGATEAGLGAHAIRHLFGAQLKKKGVTAEDRGDLLGHVGETETSERYCEPHEIEFLAELVQKLPVVTGHLEPQPIRLLPWVAERQAPPFSRPSRSRRAV
jgi:integrase